MEVLRKIDQQFGRIARAREYAARPYEIVVLSDHGQTQGATFKQRNGYGLDELVERNLRARPSRRSPAGDENDTAVGKALREATGRKQKAAAKNDVGGRQVVVLGSGNLGLVYLMDEPRRLTLEEIEERHPELLPALREHRARRLAARALGRARRRGAGRPRRQLPRRGPRRGRGSAGALLVHRGAPPAAHRRLRPRRRHHGQQLLRRAARRGLRLRGAHLVPRRHGRAADQAVPAASGPPAPARRRRSSAPRRRTTCCWAGAACCRARGCPAEAAPPQRARRDAVHDRLGGLRDRVGVGLRVGGGRHRRRRHVLRVVHLLHDGLVRPAGTEPEPRDGGHGIAPRRRTAARARWLAWLPHDKAWLAAAAQFPGTLFFNATTFRAISRASTRASTTRSSGARTSSAPCCF